MSEVILNNDNFESEVMNSDIPVLVDFWATWCGPCKMIAPFVDKVAQTFEGKIKVCKADVDECGDIAQSFNVSSIPTLLVFKGGEVVASHVGAANYALIEALVKDNI